MRLARVITVRARRASRAAPARAVARGLRRVAREAGRVLAFSLVPSLVTDVLVRHKQLDQAFVVDETTTDLWNTFFAAILYNVVVWSKRALRS
jgi:hypothetical protein